MSGEEPVEEEAVVEEPVEEESAQKPPEPLSEPYHKARRSLALFSGILIAWEYVGIGVGGTTRSGSGQPQGIFGATARLTEDEAVTAKLPGDVSISIQHAEVIPVVVAVLVLYFGLRLMIEWHLCDDRRKAMLAAKADYYFTGVLAGSALLLFIIQQASAFRLAEVFTADAMTSVMVGSVMIVALDGILHVAIRHNRYIRVTIAFVLAASPVFLSHTLLDVPSEMFAHLSAIPYLVGAMFGTCLTLLGVPRLAEMPEKEKG